MVRLVFLGPPGAGKGTQAASLAKDRGLLHLSTGDILRAAVTSKSPLGLEADGYMSRGELVPDSLVIRIVRERLKAPDALPGFILDGFPRTVAQAEALQGAAPIDRVLSFEIPEEVLFERMTQRRHCPKCGTVYNLSTAPPKIDPHRCDREGEPLVQRSDDRPEAVRTRLVAYHRQTAPLIDFYLRQGILVPIDATGSMKSVAERLRAVVP